MWNKLLAISLVLVLVSWVNSKTEVEYVEKVDEKVTITKINFEGHSYLWAEKGGKGGLTHDMNCKCFKYLWKNKRKMDLSDPRIMIPELKVASPDGY